MISTVNNQQLIIFVKAPVPGKCKTRLIPALGSEAACEFYQTLVINCLENLQHLCDIDICIYTTPDISHPFIKKLSTQYSTRVHLQQGNDLGERMHHALQQSLKHYSKAVLIGTDCPTINSYYIEQAFSSLVDNDMVFGPAEDGGYVLIGANKINPSLFKNISWSTENVLQQSLQNIKNENYNAHLLDTLRDIDTPEDYRHYIQTIKPVRSNYG